MTATWENVWKQATAGVDDSEDTEEQKLVHGAVVTIDQADVCYETDEGLAVPFVSKWKQILRMLEYNVVNAEAIGGEADDGTDKLTVPVKGLDLLIEYHKDTESLVGSGPASGRYGAIRIYPMQDDFIVITAITDNAIGSSIAQTMLEGVQHSFRIELEGGIDCPVQ